MKSKGEGDQFEGVDLEEDPADGGRRSSSGLSRQIPKIAILLPIVAVLLATLATLAFTTFTENTYTPSIRDGVLSPSIALCATASMPGTCLEERFGELADDHEVDVLTEQLYLYRQAYPQATGYCHDAASLLGAEGWARTNDVVAALRLGTPVCASGYLHGLQEAVGRQSSLTKPQVVTALVDLCAEPGLVEYQVCFHGIGHALATRYQSGRVFDTNDCLLIASDAARLPSGTDPVYTPRELCSEGMMMRYFETISLPIVEAVAEGESAQIEVASRTTGLCSSMSDVELANGCFTYVSHAFGHDRQNFDAVVRVCNALDGTAADRCFFGLSRELAYTPEAKSVESVTRYCLQAAIDSVAVNCGANVLLNRVTVINSLDDANKACAEIPVDRRTTIICERVRNTQHLNSTENVRSISNA